MLNTRLAAHCTPACRNLQGDCDPYSGPVARDGTLEALDLPGHTNLLDTQPWQIANELFRELGRQGLVSLVAAARQGTVNVRRLLCIENLTPFYELAHHRPQGRAALYLAFD